MEQRFPEVGSVFSGKFVRVLQRAHGVFELVLARPDVRNAFHAEMILEIREGLALLCARNGEVRCLVLSGEGASFSAGADLQDMRESAALDFAGNLERARGLARLFHDLASFPGPVVAVVRGAAMGGAMGLVACSDLALADESAFFGTPECRLGIVAGTIGPYLVRRLGHANAAHMLFTGRRFTAPEAQRLGLVQEVIGAASEADFLEQVERHLLDVLAGGPEASRRTKALLATLSPLPDAALAEYTAACLAQARSSDEGRAGVAAFFERKAPPWAQGLIPFKGKGAGKA